MRSPFVGFVFVFVALCAPRAFAQAPHGTLNVTVVDSTGAVISGATVTIVGVEPATKAITPGPIKTGEKGVATVSKLVPGRYSVQAEFAGFETKTLPEVRVRGGDNRQVILLPVAGVQEAVVVEQNKQAAAADPRGSSFGTTLTREQLEALSDDPDVLRQQLQEMAGPGAVFNIDSFEGGALPPKAQIRSIRISRDQFAAEHHSAGGISIEIITQPGMGPMRFNAGYRMRGDALTGRSPFVPVRGPARFRALFLGGNGTLIPNKSSWNFFFNGTDSYETPNINVALANGQRRSEALTLRSPRDNYGFGANVDYAVTLDQTLRFGINVNRNDNRNLGIGLFDEESRAFESETTFGSIRAQQIGPLGRRAFLRTRVQYSWNDSDSRSAAEEPTIRVIDWFTRGGAQVRGGQHSKTLVVGADLDYVRNIHTLRTGLLIDAGRWRSNDESNYIGTYTFETIDAFNEGRPRSYTRRIGDPNLSYSNVQTGVYIQDDIRVRRNVTVSAGVRYEMQTHVEDKMNFGPRFGVTYAPFASGRTTLRGSWGIFYDWLSMNTYEQALRVDGFRQQEIDIVNPTFPVIDEAALLTTPGRLNRYQLGEMTFPSLNRASLGIDQRLTRFLQSTVTYAFTRGSNLARGVNLNAAVDGVRPDPRFNNVIQVATDAKSRLHTLQVGLTANPGALLPIGNASAPRVSFKRITVFYNYTLGFQRNNTEGAFSLAPTGDLDLEWGPTNADVRHRMNVSVNNQIIKNLGIGFNFNTASGSPYTLRTGRDDNGDLVFNDRPVGVGRNTERGAAHVTVNMNLSYNVGFGRGPSGPPGIAVIASGGGAPVVQSVEQSGRYRIGFFVNAQNLTNRANYVGYVGTISSTQFFRQPTNVLGTRRVETGINFNF